MTRAQGGSRFQDALLVFVVCGATSVLLRDLTAVDAVLPGLPPDAGASLGALGWSIAARPLGLAVLLVGAGLLIFSAASSAAVLGLVDAGAHSWGAPRTILRAAHLDALNSTMYIVGALCLVGAIAAYALIRTSALHVSALQGEKEKVGVA